MIRYYSHGAADSWHTRHCTFKQHVKLDNVIMKEEEEEEEVVVVVVEGVGGPPLQTALQYLCYS